MVKTVEYSFEGETKKKQSKPMIFTKKKTKEFSGWNWKKQLNAVVTSRKW